MTAREGECVRLQDFGRCSDCGAPAEVSILRARNPEWVARVVADVNGFLTAADFKEVPLCATCAERDL